MQKIKHFSAAPESKKVNFLPKFDFHPSFINSFFIDSLTILKITQTG
jgi:hypothetical protein